MGGWAVGRAVAILTTGQRLSKEKRILAYSSGGQLDQPREPHFGRQHSATATLTILVPYVTQDPALKKNC
jgi:hypothetical protein